MLKVTVVNNIKFPEITLQEWLEHVAQNIIMTDLVMRIDNGASIDGGMLPENEDSTRIRKMELGQGDRPLLATRLLRSSFYYKTEGKNKVIITIDDSRKKIGGYLQSGVGKMNKQYRFFGVSKVAKNSAIEYVNKKIKELTSGK